MYFFWFKYFVQFVSCLHFLCNFSIKTFACIVFGSNCHKRGYGVYYTVQLGNKITICNVKIIKIFKIKKWNSLQGPFIHTSWVIFQKAKFISLCLLYFAFGVFVTQYIKEWSDITALITPDSEIFSWLLSIMSLIKVEVLLVILVGQPTS